PWRDALYLDLGAGKGVTPIAYLLNSEALPSDGEVVREFRFTLPIGFPEGNFRWVVDTSIDRAIYERGSYANNSATASTGVLVARPDLAVSAVSVPTRVASGERLRVDWTVDNSGAVASGDWLDSVYLVQGSNSRLLAERAHSDGLAAGARYSETATVDVPVDADGDYQIVVITDSAGQIDDRQRNDNRRAAALHADLSPYADLVVDGLAAPERIVADPAGFDVTWTVSNRGTGAGRSAAWSDRVVLSSDEVFGNGDDRVVGEYRHEGALAGGESYLRCEHIVLPAGTRERYRLFVVADAKSEVFENGSEANNITLLAHPLDVMPLPYADLQVVSVAAAGTAASGRPLQVSWEVVNNGIGVTDTADWTDSLWLSRNRDGTDVVTTFGSARHLGQLAVGDRYTRSLDIVLPEGIAGRYYLNVRT
ncbi:MAG TPA: CARDB domain-containing protein, partial [Pirellulaceae bacterium]|nr:CARDB domain-containing protein [Pirellulaceae bacterium]